MSGKNQDVIDAVLFDIGGVIIPLGGLKDIMGFLPDDLSLEGLRDKWLGCQAVKDFESGMTDSETFSVSVCAELRLRMGPSDFLDIFGSWPLDVPRDTVAVLERITSRLRSATLSNTNSIHWERIEDRLSGLFIHHFPSHLTRILKPDPKAFFNAADKLGADPSKTIFFDDTEINVKSAKDSGFLAFCVKNVAEAEKILSAIMPWEFWKD